MKSELKLMSLAELEARAIELKRSGDFSGAAGMLSELLQREPSWDHGYGEYDLACCLEDAGNMDAARVSFLRALTFDPNDRVFVGGYASFLYLHGDPREAFNWQLKLLKCEFQSGNEEGCNDVKFRLRSNGLKIGMEMTDIEALIISATRSERDV